MRQVSPRLAYLIPDFHNPTGALMDDEQRARVAHALDRGRAVAVVDETLAEMAVDDVTMPAPFGAHAADAVSVGSASKAYWGGLRIGWLRAPADRVGALVSARLSLDLGAPLLEQLALTALLERHHEVTAARREQVRTSRAALVAALADRLPDWRFTPPRAGWRCGASCRRRSPPRSPRPPSGSTCCWRRVPASPRRAGWSATSGCPTPAPPRT